MAMSFMLSVQSTFAPEPITGIVKGALVVYHHDGAVVAVYHKGSVLFAPVYSDSHIEAVNFLMHLFALPFFVRNMNGTNWITSRLTGETRYTVKPYLVALADYQLEFLDNLEAIVNA